MRGCRIVIESLPLNCHGPISQPQVLVLKLKFPLMQVDDQMFVFVTRSSFAMQRFDTVVDVLGDVVSGARSFIQLLAETSARNGSDVAWAKRMLARRTAELQAQCWVCKESVGMCMRVHACLFIILL